MSKSPATLPDIRHGGAAPVAAHPLTVPLLASVSAPSGADFADIYQQHVDFVWRYAATHGVDAASLDDVVQEVFMVVHGRLSSFAQRSSLKTWVAGIAVNVVRGFRRRRTARRIGEPLADGEEVAAPQATAAEALELKQSLELLDGVLAKMTELQREAFVLCELEQFSQVEVAGMLGINENTLRTRLRSARQLVNELARDQRERGAT